MNVRENGLGWGLVVIALGVLTSVLMNRSAEFPNMLPEAQLRQIAEQYARWHDPDEVTDKVESVIMSGAQWAAKSGGYDGRVSREQPVYIYRIYGNYKQAGIWGGDGFPDYYFQAVDIVLHGETGELLSGVAYPKDHPVPDLFYIPEETMVGAKSFAPTIVSFEVTEEVK